MRLATAWFVVVGVATVVTATPARADTEGFWFSVASGVAGSATPGAYEETWFATPHGPPQVAVTSLTGGTAQATTAGGSSFFSGAAGSVVLSPTNGYAYLASGNQPSDLSQALKRQMAGGTGLASAAPSTTAAPAGADLLSVAQTATALTVSLTDPNKNVLASANVAVPAGGWWVIGLGPNPNAASTTTPPTTPIITVPVPVPTPGPTGGAVATPEPATGLLAAVGGLGAYGLRLIKRRRA